MDDETGESLDFKKCKTTNCTRLMGLSSFVVIGNNITGCEHENFLLAARSLSRL